MTESDFKEVVKEIRKLFDEKPYKIEFIRRLLNEKQTLRRTFVAVLLQNPARLGEIKERVFFSKNALYSYLYKLREIGLLEKISIMNIWNKKNLENEEKEVLQKFEEWTKTMASGQLQYFAGRTNYWALTDLGRDTKILNWVFKLERELKNG